MKNITNYLLLIVSLSIVSCSQPPKIEGIWETQKEEDRTGMTITGTESYEFTPNSKKEGKVVTIYKAKAIIDSFGDFKINISVPGVYAIQKDMIVITNDLDQAQSDITFHPTSFIGLLVSEEAKELEENIKNELGILEPVDTLKNVTVKDNVLTITKNTETTSYKKKE